MEDMNELECYIAEEQKLQLLYGRGAPIPWGVVSKVNYHVLISAQCLGGQDLTEICFINICRTPSLPSVIPFPRILVLKSASR